VQEAVRVGVRRGHMSEAKCGSCPHASLCWRPVPDPPPYTCCAGAGCRPQLPDNAAHPRNDGGQSPATVHVPEDPAHARGSHSARPRPQPQVQPHGHRSTDGQDGCGGWVARGGASRRGMHHPGVLRQRGLCAHVPVAAGALHRRYWQGSLYLWEVKPKDGCVGKLPC
jgi:hypothetical protein